MAQTPVISRRGQPAPDPAFPSAPPDRSPPHSAEAEEHVIACCLLDGSDTIARCLEARLTPECFYTPANRLLFEVIVELYQKSPPVTLEMIAEELKTRRQLEAVGGFPYLMQVTGKIPTTAHAGYFIEKVREKHILRELIKSATGVVEQAYAFTGGLEEFVDKVETDLFAVTQDRVSDSAQEIKESVKEANTVIAKLLMKKGELTGVTSGFKDLDAMTFGFQRQEMIVIAARPSMGKTSFALNIAENAAIRFKVPVGLFSLEMSKEQLVMRLLCSQSEVALHKLRNGFLGQEDWPRLTTGAGLLTQAPIQIDDSAALTVLEVRAKCRRLMAEAKLGLVIIDYLQLMRASGPSENRVQEISQISRSLKALAKELDVPVIALSQLSRAVETRGGGGRPQLSDLRESGSIEQDADVVMFVYREEKYKHDDPSVKGLADIIIAKQRNGPTGDVKMTFLHEFTKFVPWSPTMPGETDQPF
jgi:replicative DNA helicase